MNLLSATARMEFNCTPAESSDGDCSDLMFTTQSSDVGWALDFRTNDVIVSDEDSG